MHVEAKEIRNCKRNRWCLAIEEYVWLQYYATREVVSRKVGSSLFSCYGYISIVSCFSLSRNLRIGIQCLDVFVFSIKQVCLYHGNIILIVYIAIIVIRRRRNGVNHNSIGVAC